MGGQVKNIFENPYPPLMDGGYCVISLSGIQFIDFEIGSPGLGGDKASDSQFELHENFIDEDSNEYDISIFNSYDELFISIDLDSDDDILVTKLKKLISIEILIKPPNFSNDEAIWNSSYGVYSPPIQIPNFFAVRLSHQNGIKTLKQYYEDEDYITDFVIDGLTHHKNSIKTNDLIFLVASGWKDSMSFSYIQGLYGIARVTSLPYNQNAKSYTIDVQIIFFFDKILTKQDFLNYPKTADIPYIGPSTKGTKTQAISTISVEDAKEVLICAQKITKTEINIFNKYFPWFFKNTFDVSEKKFSKMTDDHSPALEVTAIANVFAEFIKNYSHEDSSTMIGIFGRWGRGKTFFYKEVKKAMLKNHSVNEKYYFCEFQPWKYQEKESAWAYLYQSVLHKFLNNNTGWWCYKCKLAKLAWLNLQKIGISRIILFFLVMLVMYFAIDSIPLLTTDSQKAIPKFITKYGTFSILLYLGYKIFDDHKETALKIINNYTKNNYLLEKLGFQNEIQEEFKTLVKTFFINSSEEEKLILFIDDLDRCNEDLLIDIIDSLRLILDDEEIRRRIIVLTAIDERILFKSILKKYTFTQKKDNPVSTNEYIEKFFLMGIKLDSLNKDDISKLVDQYSNKINLINTQIEAVQDSPEIYESTANIPYSVESPKEENTQLDKSKKLKLDGKPLYIMGKEEQDYLKEHMIKISDATPRKINMFIHRYLFLKALAFTLLKTREFKSIDPKLYIDLIFLISQNSKKYNELAQQVNETSETENIVLKPYEYEYQLTISEALKIFKITSMVSPF